MIRYDPLWETLQKKHISQYELINKHHFSTGTLDALRKNKSVSMHTINMLCDIIDCELGDIAVYVRDKDIDE